MDHIVKANDNPTKLAIQYVKDSKRWPELCAANPNLAKHSEWGCVFPAVGKAIKLPDSWVTEQGGDSATEATTSLEPNSTIDPKYVVVGGVAVAGAVLYMYMRGKKKMTANRRRARRRSYR